LQPSGDHKIVCTSGAYFHGQELLLYFTCILCLISKSTNRFICVCYCYCYLFGNRPPAATSDFSSVKGRGLCWFTMTRNYLRVGILGFLLCRKCATFGLFFMDRQIKFQGTRIGPDATDSNQTMAVKNLSLLSLYRSELVLRENPSSRLSKMSF
jgi:hypothetical protein